MFRNGIIAGRRQFAGRPWLFDGRCTTIRKHEPPQFVCIKCQDRRAMATAKLVYMKKARKAGPPEKPENMMAQIKKLEQHVQAMERSYLDRLKLRAASQSIPKGDLSEKAKDMAYAALMAGSEDTKFLPIPKPKKAYSLLTGRVRQRLGIGKELIIAGQEPRWEAAIDQLDFNGGFGGMHVDDANSVLVAMNVDARVQLADKIMTMMEDESVMPNTFTYDIVMRAHAAVGNVEDVKDLYQLMKENEVKPSVYTYGSLLKAYSIDKDVPSAAAAFEEMQEYGIEPNLIVYTTLIQTCINATDYDMAWQIFNLIKFKSTSTAPDVEAYNLMIHACAENGEAERAVDLWTDMTVRKGIQPTERSFNTIIHACAMRKDYFTTAWKYALEMKVAGMQLNQVTQNVLIQACGRVGELTRARLLVRHLALSATAGMEPDLFTFQHLLRAYATYKPPKKTRKTKWDFLKTPEAVEKKEEAIFVQNTETLTKSDDPNMPNISERLEIPFLEKSILQDSREVLDESSVIISWLRDYHPHMVDTQLMNAYLDVCVAHNSFSDYIWCYDNDFCNSPSTAEPVTSGPELTVLPPKSEDAILADDLPPLPRNIFTYRSALAAAFHFRDVPFARRVWADREAYIRDSPERDAHYGLRDGDKDVQMMQIDAELLMINVLATGELLGEAKERMEAVQARGHRWSWKDLNTLYARAVQLEDPETIVAVKKATGVYQDNMDFDERLRREWREQRQRELEYEQEQGRG